MRYVPVKTQKTLYSLLEKKRKRHKTYIVDFITHRGLSQADHPNEQRRQFILDSRAMRQQIKTGISREFEQSYRVTRHMTDSNIMQTLPQTALSLVQ